MPIHNIHSDSVNGDLSSTDAKLRKRSGHITAVEGRNIELAYYQREIDRRYKDLPAVKGADANINYLGSSYSGTDIKVVAHMYDTQNWNEERLEELNRDLGIAKNIIDGCNSLLGGGLAGLSQSYGSNATYDLRRREFLSAAGFDIGDSGADLTKQEASRIMLANIFDYSDLSFLGIARMQRRTDKLLRDYVRLSRELEQQIEILEKSGVIESSSTIVLGTLQTISIQSFREKNAVRALGHAAAKGYTRGTRTIGGSCIFTIFNEHALNELIRGIGSSPHFGGGTRDQELSTLLADQLPPIDMTIVFANEYGSLSDFRLYGVEFFTDGSVFSIEDLLSEETMNFIARDTDPMRTRGEISTSRLQRGMHNDKDDKDKTGSSLVFDDADYLEYLGRLGCRRRLTNR